MQEQTAIVDLDLARDVAAVRDALAAYRDAEATASQRRYELGRALIRIRPRWPASGPNARGWGEFLASVDLDSQRASELMRYAGYVDEISPTPGGNLPSMREAGVLPPRESEPMPPPAAELGAPPVSPDDMSPEQADDEVEIDRDTWCTPKWLTDALGEVDLDPCANELSHVDARETYRLDHGQDGLDLAAGVFSDQRVFINPPYSDVRPWIAAYKHTNFVFLLKLDPSTKWFIELFEATALILIPRGTRIEFEAPPGVPKEKSGANQFPHALFLARAEDATEELIRLCFAWRTR